jgi:hypothetical protein
MSAVAAMAVASPFAMSALSEMTASSKPEAQQHEFVQAAMVTDLPGEIMSALQSSLSQFGVVVPNIPSGITGAAAAPGLTGTPGLTAPGLTAPTTGLPGTTGAAPALLDPSGALTDPALANPGLTNPAATIPGTIPGAPAAPGLTTPTIPGAPAVPGLTAAPGLTTPPTGLNPALTSPTGAVPGLTAAPGEVPIGPDPLAGTYPILGDPSLGGIPGAAAPAQSGGLLSELSNTVNQLGGSQAIDLLKGVVVPSIMQAIKGAAPAGVPAVPPPPAPVP